jgi:peptide/nickel transport system permease protein
MTAASTADVPRIATSAEVAFHRRGLMSRLPLRAKIALGILALVIVAAVLAPVLPIDDPLAGNLAQRLLPFGSPGHILGTDSQGRDMLSRLVYGTRTSLIAGVVPVAIVVVVGMLWGTVAALSRRWAGNLMMRVTDVMFAFPGVLLSLLLAIKLGQGLQPLIIALSVVWIAPIARIADTEVARIRDLDFMMAARSSGASSTSILLRQVLPVALPAVLAYATSLVGANIAIAGGLGFIGLGVQVPTPELGSMLQEMQSEIYNNPSLSLTPAMVVVLLAILFPIVGDGLRHAVIGRGDS